MGCLRSCPGNRIEAVLWLFQVYFSVCCVLRPRFFVDSFKAVFELLLYFSYIILSPSLFLWRWMALTGLKTKSLNVRYCV